MQVTLILFFSITLKNIQFNESFLLGILVNAITNKQYKLEIGMYI